MTSSAMGPIRGAFESAQKEKVLFNEQEERVVVENADVSTASPPAKKPRKKSQAFGVPKTAALKAKIDINAAESPLLRLPREVRSRIWVLVIGNRLLHIRTSCKVHPEGDHSSYYDSSVSKKLWTTSCCMLLNSEQEIFQRSKIPIEELVNQDERDYGSYLDAAALRKLSSCSAERTKVRMLHLQQSPHHQCRHYLQDMRSGKCNVSDGRTFERYQAKEHVVQVQILQVCRQVYIEANPILWSSNTLAFGSPADFRVFMSERVAAQKASITRLLLDFSWDTCGHTITGESKRATSNGIITALTGLRTLHLYIEDAVYRNDHPATGNVDEKQEIAEWQRSTKINEACDGFTNFKRLPLQEVTVLMLCKPDWSIAMQDWRHAERIKYSETVRDTILDPEGFRKLQQEQADAKAARKAELAQLKLASPPCRKFSTEEECAKANQERIDGLSIANGKSRSSRPQAQACRSEHVCIVCLLILDRTRELARRCQKPGQCAEAYFSVMFKNSDDPSKSMNISVRPEDTIDTILDRYVGVSGTYQYVSYNAQLEGVALKPEATVQDVGLKKDCKMEVVVAQNWAELISIFDFRQLR